MRLLTLILLLAVFSCKNNASDNDTSAPDASSAAPPPKTTGYPYVFNDTILVSLGPKDFAAVTKSKPNMPILDLRGADRYKRGHIWRSVNMDADAKDFYTRISGFGRNQEYAVYCQNGAKSLLVAEKMKKMGFLRIYHLQRGLFNWGETGQALQIK